MKYIRRKSSTLIAGVSDTISFANISLGYDGRGLAYKVCKIMFQVVKFDGQVGVDDVHLALSYADFGEGGSIADVDSQVRTEQFMERDDLVAMWRFRHQILTAAGDQKLSDYCILDFKDSPIWLIRRPSFVVRCQDIATGVQCFLHLWYEVVKVSAAEMIELLKMMPDSKEFLRTGLPGLGVGK